MLNVCYSGGAQGADTLFTDLALAAGHGVINLSFRGHKNNGKNTVILTDEELKKADFYLKAANKILKRTFPANSEHTNNLLRRNFWQIHQTNRVYAVTAFDENMLPYGGTAWAVIMAMGEHPIYFYDQDKKKWFLHYGLPMEPWKELDEPPKAEGIYTGIGTRRLNKDGINAIKSLYERN